MEDNDRLIEQFMKQSRQEIADDGFTERVMRELPDRQAQYDWLPWVWNAVMIVISLLLFFAFGGAGLVKDALYQQLDMALTQGIDLRVVFSLMCAFVFFISYRTLQKA